MRYNAFFAYSWHICSNYDATQKFDKQEKFDEMLGIPANANTSKPQRQRRISQTYPIGWEDRPPANADEASQGQNGNKKTQHYV